MKKQDILRLIQGEVKEFNAILESMQNEETVQPLLIQLSNSKVENMQNLLQLLQSECGAKVPIAEPEVAVETKVPQETLTSMGNSSIASQPADRISEVNPDEKTDNESEVSQEKQTKQATDSNDWDTPDESTTHTAIVEEMEEPILDDDDATTDEKIDRPEWFDAIKQKSSNTILQGGHVNDIRKAIPVIERFRFKKELFSNNEDLMNSTIDALNKATSLSEASNILAPFAWPENDSVKAFLDIVSRKFK